MVKNRYRRYGGTASPDVASPAGRYGYHINRRAATNERLHDPRAYLRSFAAGNAQWKKRTRLRCSGRETAYSALLAPPGPPPVWLAAIKMIGERKTKKATSCWHLALTILLIALLSKMLTETETSSAASGNTAEERSVLIGCRRPNDADVFYNAGLLASRPDSHP